jgi:putative pyruvate formate lyase activating enzyme
MVLIGTVLRRQLGHASLNAVCAMIVDLIDPQRLDNAAQHLTNCALCEHRCHVNRRLGERGPCKAGCEARVFRHRVEFGEEVELVPSHLFYLSGCDLRCCFCIAEANAFDPSAGTRLTSSFLVDALAKGRQQGARNLQWVGGEPTIHIPAIMQAMADCRDLPPIVWKSDFYGTPEAFELLDGVADVYVADFKFGNNTCALQLAKVERYMEIVTRNLHDAQRQGDLIIRHLLLPGHFDCCYRPIVDYLASAMPHVKFSIRTGYLPRWQARHYGPLGHPLDTQVAGKAFELAKSRELNIVD